MHGDSYPSVPSPAAFADTIVEDMNADPCTSWLGSANHEVWNVDQEVQERCQEAALTRRIAWRRSREGVGFSPSGKQLHPATPELTAWREGLADSLQ